MFDDKWDTNGKGLNFIIFLCLLGFLCGFCVNKKEIKEKRTHKINLAIDPIAFE